MKKLFDLSLLLVEQMKEVIENIIYVVFFVNHVNNVCI